MICQNPIRKLKLQNENTIIKNSFKTIQTQQDNKMQVQKQEAKRFCLGQNIDAKDSSSKWRWLNAQVMGFQGNKVYLHYTGWHPKFDELVDVDSSRLIKQWQPSKRIQVNNRLDVYHPVGGWLQATVIELGRQNQKGEINQVKVHFFNYHAKYDMWVNLKDRNQVAIIGEKSKAHGMGKRKRRVTKQQLTTQLIRKILRQKLAKLLKQLHDHNFTMKQVGGDGNCLFRSISDQLYGEQTYHNQIRQLCMRYILQEKEFFQNFLVQDIEQYVQRKARDGVWGDDVEIQALSEIYARPIEIYAMGIRPIRTFHEDNEGNVEPLRVAYIGSCHYNSIKRKGDEGSRAIQTPFGHYETNFMNSYMQYKNSLYLSKNRQNFSHCNPLQLTYQERIQAETNQNPSTQQTQTQLMQQVIEQSENQQISKEIQAAELRQLQNRLEQQAIEKQLKRLEEQELQQAIKQSQRNNKAQQPRPYWFQDLLAMGFSQQQILFAIQIKGYDADAVQNFLFDNM